jgi:nucleotide-binding universal stress UspA family protein
VQENAGACAGSVALSVKVVAETSADSVESITSAILKHAQDLNAAALVTLSGHKGELEEFLLGSVTASLAHRSEVPVLVVT